MIYDKNKLKYFLKNIYLIKKLKISVEKKYSVSDN